MKRRVLFLCTGNSCRSQMAEAIANARLGDDWETFSAGTQPAGYIHPKAVAVLAEIGIDWQGRASKHVDEFQDAPFDLVVTVCDDAAENCPLWLAAPETWEQRDRGKQVHLGFPDPAKATGTDEEVLAVFRKVRDAIADQVPALLHNWAGVRSE
jgi:arsenate reductase